MSVVSQVSFPTDRKAIHASIKRLFFGSAGIGEIRAFEHGKPLGMDKNGKPIRKFSFNHARNKA